MRTLLYSQCLIAIGKDRVIQSLENFERVTPDRSCLSLATTLTIMFVLLLSLAGVRVARRPPTFKFSRYVQAAEQ
jgi:hypothetical protein